MELAKYLFLKYQVIKIAKVYLIYKQCYTNYMYIFKFCLPYTFRVPTHIENLLGAENLNISLIWMNIFDVKPLKRPFLAIAMLCLLQNLPLLK